MKNIYIISCKWYINTFINLPIILQKKNPSNIFNQKIKGQCTLTTIFFNFPSK